MVEQEKREKVVKGLECCKQGADYTDPICSECPYSDEYAADCVPMLAADALALLKAQEPETSDAPKSDSDIWCWYDITHNYTLEQVVSALKAKKPVEPNGEQYQCNKCKSYEGVHNVMGHAPCSF